MKLPALLCPVLLAIPLEDVEHATRHFRLIVSGTIEEAQEAGEVLELARERLKALFRAQPARKKGARHTVRILENRLSWLTAIRSRGVEPPALADFVHYLPDEDTVFLYGGETAYARRALLLHGATQQFHCQAKPKNRDLVRTWLTMGLADHLSMHTWDGKTLTLGVLPLACDDDIFGRARAALTAQEFNPAALFEDGIAQPEICMVLIRYLLDESKPARRKKFTKLGLGYNGSKLHPQTYVRLLGDPESLSAQLIDWIDTHQLVLETVAGHWEDRGQGGLYADALGGEARALFKSSPERLLLACRPDESLSATPGVVFEDAGTGSDWTLRVLPEELLVTGTLPDGRPYERAIPHAVRAGKALHLDIVHEEGELTLFAEREQVEHLELDVAAIGLFVEGGSATFEGVSWR
ncbi:MAG: hypothetical protein CMJ84_07540 [Planctomycetes bacterium]|jgi:hypothetical protein|nr:hypothetical protein [Planctomycetota bacterium]MDP6410394.1 hypothetical protein [Planctomycetota bacterium]